MDNTTSPNAADSSGLGFRLELRGDVWVVQYDSGGCHPANADEIKLWHALEAAEAALKRRDTEAEATSIHEALHQYRIRGDDDAYSWLTEYALDLAAAPVSLEAVKAETTDEQCDQCAAPEMSFDDARGLGRSLALCTAHWNRWVLRWMNSDDEPGVSAHLIQGVTHAAPTGGSGVMPCCGRTPFEVSPTQRMTLDPDSVTCIPDVPVSTEGDNRG